MKTSMKFLAEDDGSLASFAAGAFAQMKASGISTEDPPADNAAAKSAADAKAAEDAAKAKADEGKKGDPLADLPEGLSTDNTVRSEQWKKFRDQYHSVRDTVKTKDTELSTLQQQLSDFEGTKKERDELKGRITDLEKKEQEWNEVRSVSELERRPDYQRDFIKPREEAAKQLSELAGYAEIKPEELKAAVAKTGKARFDALEEVLAGVSGSLRGRIERIVDRLDELDTAAGVARQNAAEEIQRRETQTQQQQRQRVEEFNKQAVAVFDSTAAELKDLGLTPEEVAAAKVDFTQNKDIGKASKILLKAYALDHTAKELTEARVKLKEMGDELARLKKASPDADAGTLIERMKQGGDVDFTEGAKAIFRSTRAA